jgi:hypothetical protein
MKGAKFAGFARRFFCDAGASSIPRMVQAAALP